MMRDRPEITIWVSSLDYHTPSIIEKFWKGRVRVKLICPSPSKNRQQIFSDYEQIIFSNPFISFLGQAKNFNTIVLF
jgi:hypothetical protein